MLAARIAKRVLSRMISFGFKGALVMAIAGTFEGLVFGIALNFVPRPQSAINGSQDGALLMAILGFVIGLLVFSFAGGLTSRRNDARQLFAQVARSAVIGSFVGAISGAICFASLFAMLTWWTQGKFLPVDVRAPMMAMGSILASAFMGYLLGVALGFFVGTAFGAWRGAVKSAQQESSTR